MQIAWLLLIRELSSQIAIQNQLDFDSFTTFLLLERTIFPFYFMDTSHMFSIYDNKLYAFK